MRYSHKEFPGRRALSSGRVELMYTLRCLASIRLEGWEGVIHHRLDNQGVVKKYGRMGRGFRIATAADADLWAGMRQYFREWGHVTKVFWVKAHAEKDGKKTTCHEKQNKLADDSAEEAYQHLESPDYRLEYVSQLDSVYGPTIHGKVVVHKMGATMLRHIQTKHFLRYWKTRTNAGAWSRNVDIEGHAAACRRAQKANPNTVSSGSFKEMNDFRLTHDREHQRDHKYDPTDLATGTEWMIDTIDSWILSEDGEIADIASQLLVQEGLKGIADAITVKEKIDATMLSAKIHELSGGHTVIPRKRIEADVHPRMEGRHRPGGQAQLPTLPTAGHQRALQALLHRAISSRSAADTQRAAYSSHLLPRTQKHDGRGPHSDAHGGRPGQARPPWGDGQRKL